MLDSTNINNSPILWWSGFPEGRFTIIKEDPALYSHTCVGPVTYMKTVVTKWATQFRAWGSTLHTVEAIKQFVSVLNEHSHRQVGNKGRDKIVVWNLKLKPSHMALPVCSGISLQVSWSVSARSIKIVVKEPSFLRGAQSTDFLGPQFCTVNK